MKKFLKAHYSLVLKLVLSGLILLSLTINVCASTYDWIGGTSTDVSNVSNWSKVGFLGCTTTVPGSGDDVRIGVSSTYTSFSIICISLGSSLIPFTYSPTVTANTTWKSLTFGYYGPQGSYTYGTNEAISLTVNSGITLTVTGNVTQNHNPSTTGSTFNYIKTTIAGAGTMLCQGSFVVGDAVTQPASSVADVSQVSVQITQLTISGNLLLNANGNNGSGGTSGICYPWFSVEKGITTLAKQITFATNNSPLAGGYDTYNSPLTTFPGYGKVTADNTASSPSTFELQYKTPIVLADKFYVYFTYGGNNGTVLYDDPTAENQTIYTANEPSVTTTTTYINITAPAYYNLTFSGSSTKLVDKNSTIGTTTQGLTVGNSWNTSGGAVNLNTNNPTVTVSGSWTNAASVTQGTGNITITGSITNNSGGTLNLGAGNFYIATNYTNNVGGVYTQGAGTTYFNGAGAQALVDNSTTGTLFKIVNFSGGGTATMSAGTNNINFAVSSTGTLTMSNNSQLVAGTVVCGCAAYLTLNSDATGSATVAAIMGTAGISGNVNVQRYLNGGSNYRGYRIMSSPVYVANMGSYNVYNINYLDNNVVLTGTGGGFDKTGNPTLYLFREDQIPSNATFTSGNFWGISTINNTPDYNYYLNGVATVYNIPAGDGYLFFFRGNKASASLATETTPGYVPVTVDVTALGTLNQGQVIVRDWYTSTSTYLGYTGTGTGTNSKVRGFNMVGNPYASSIDWNLFNTTTPASGIYGNNVGTSIYELNPKTGNYTTYQQGGANTNNATSIIVSGQGFFVVAANNSNPQLIFNESAKTATQNTGLNLFMDTRAAMARLDNVPVEQHLKIQLAMDSINTDDTYIGFNANASTAYVMNEDAPYKAGEGKVSFSSVSGDGILLAINKLPLPDKQSETIPLSVNTVAGGTYQLNRTEFVAIPQLYEIWLMDAYKKDSLDMRNNETYTFNVSKADTNSYGKNRFSLIIRQNPALGVHLLSFTAAKTKGGAQIAWTTENEQNYTNFTVERTTDGGITFDPLTNFISSAAGDYGFLDKNPLIAVDGYRLKITDLNGTVSYSSIIVLNYGGANNSIASSEVMVYPNPANSTINLSINQSNQVLSASPPLLNLNAVPVVYQTVNQTTYGIQIISTNGIIIKNETSNQPSVQENVSTLLPGAYIIQVTNNKDKSLIGKSTFVKL